jgi:hypothetical protein
MSKLKDNCPHFLWMLRMLHRLLVHVGFYGCYEKIVTKRYKVHSLSIEKQYKNPKSPK